MTKLFPMLLLAMCLANSCFGSTDLSQIKAAICGKKSMKIMEDLVKESVKLLETAEERNIDVGSCKWDMVQIRTSDAKTLLESGAAIRDAVHSVSNQLAEKNNCIKGLLGLRG